MDELFAIIGNPSVRGVASALRYLAERTGENAFLRAARALGQGSAGRPALDDRRLIEEATWLLANGEAKSLNAALTKVAGTVNGRSKRSVAERLRRKIARQAKNSSTK